MKHACSVLLGCWFISCLHVFAQGPLIYGYLSIFPSQVPATSSNEVAWLNKYHVNYVQFYDWQWKHHWPLAGTVQSPSNSWQDISGRTNYSQTILDMINACNNYGMKAMNYNLLYGALAGYGQDGSGVNFQWGLWNDSSGCNGTQWSVPVFSTTIYMFNPGDTNWQNYIFHRENDAFAVYPFDGWQVDQLGDPGTKYTCPGTNVDVWTTFAGFLNNAKGATGKRIIFNNVGTYGMFSSINQTTNDAVYVECWESSGQNTYNDLKTVIDNGLSWGNGKPVVLAAYMDRGVNSGSFNPPGVLLCDAAIFASGGTHIELGDGGHMLCNEYFPNETLTLSTALANTLTNYYNFILSYQPLLYGGLANSSNKITMSIASSNTATANEVWAFAKASNGTNILNLINLVGESNIAWRDNLGNYPAPTPQSNFSVKYYYGSGTANNVNLASPDMNGGAATALSFTNGMDAGGNFVSFTVPSLTYWDMIQIQTSASQAPAAPTGLTAAGGNLVVNLNWTQSTSPGITSNNVYRSTSGSGGPYNLLANLAAAMSYSDTAVSAGNTYYYSVTAVNANGESALSAYAGATTVPPSPTGLTAAPGNNQVALSWSASTGASSYNVKRATVSGGPYTAIASGVTATSYTDTTAVNGATYYYVVSAVNSSGESANSLQVSATPSAPTAPATPTNLSASAGRKKITLTWTQSTSPNITTNNVYWATVSGGPYSKVASIAATTSYTNTGLTTGTTYYYVVTAVNSSDLESPYSNQASATAK